jgi:hypothetical protein
MMLLLTGFSVGATAFYIVLRSMWERMGKGDPRKVLAEEIGDSVRRQMERRLQRRIGVE